MSTADPYGAVRAAPGWGCRKDKMPVGTVVIRQREARRRIRHARYIKVKDDGPPGRRWKPYARWWWEKNRGAVPAGKLVLHRDGDELNDEPGNLVLGTPGMKLVFAHSRDGKWSKEQHRRAASGTAQSNRDRGRINRAGNFLKRYWYPVVDELGVILNVPFRRRKRLLVCFGADVSKYPKNGHGKHSISGVKLALSGTRARPARSEEFSLRRYSTYCLLDPVSMEYRGPVSQTIGQLVAQLDRMGVWRPAEKYAKKDLGERK